MASVKKTVKSKVGQALKKLTKGADWLGFFGGYAATIMGAGGGDLIGDMVSIHTNAIVRHNIFAVADVPNRIQDPNWNPLLITGAIMTVGGMDPISRTYTELTAAILIICVATDAFRFFNEVNKK